MRRLVVVIGILAMLLVGCGVKLPDHIDLPTQLTGGDPKTLDAATKAAQEIADRLTSGDFAGVWLMMSKQVRDNISQADYVTLQNACTTTGLPARVTGVRLDSSTTAIVRWNIDLPVLSGFKIVKTMVYEDGKWVLAPDPDYAPDYGLPVQQIIAKRKAAGHCGDDVPTTTSLTPSPSPTTATQPTPTYKTWTTAPPGEKEPPWTTPATEPAPQDFVVPGTRYAFPAYYSQLSLAQERPTDLALNRRFYSLSNLAWTSWGPDGADGSGEENTQTNCDPSCADGTRYTDAVRIHASNPQPPPSGSGCPTSVMFYTDVVLSYPNGSTAPHNASGDDFQRSTTNGVEAIHYWNRVPTCEVF